MEDMFPSFLNIRQKIMVGLTFGLAIIGFIGGLSYHYLKAIERKQHFVEVADDLSNIILEVRRYEKNFLLYGSPEDLEQNRRYIQEGMVILDAIAPEMESLKADPLLRQLKDNLTRYQQIITGIATSDRGTESLASTEESLRDLGKNLVDLAQNLVSFERERILNIIMTLKTQLIATLGILVIMGAILIPFVSRKIIHPLKVIERTTLRIAQGDFRPIPVLNTRDETQQVVEAFNRMVSELEKHQDQLLQAKKLSSLGILTSGVAHQLNNPLNNISTSCQIVLEELGEMDLESMRRMLTNVEQEVQRARNIVRALLEFSRAREFSRTPTPLAQVVDRSLSLISSQVPPNVQILTDIPPDLVLNLDSQRMQQVFLNLLMNAIQAIHDPPGQVRIHAKTDDDTHEAVIAVEDTGAGIPEKDIGRIFDPFFTTKEVGIGTGLGLSIAYGTIKKHDGTISVESRQGEGTRFIIRLPLMQQV